MEPNVTAIERAFQLARLGIFLQVTEIKERMREEGYFTESITGPTLLNQLRDIMQAAQKSRWKRARAFAGETVALPNPLRRGLC